MLRVTKHATLLKKRLWHRCFPVDFAKFLRTPFLQNTLRDCFCVYTFLVFNKSTHCFKLQNPILKHLVKKKKMKIFWQEQPVFLSQTFKWKILQQI